MSWIPISATILVFAVSGVIFRAIPILQPYCMSLAVLTSLSVPMFIYGWSLRRYIYFSLGGLMLMLLTLQIPIALIVNPWKVDWLPGLGGMFLMVWLCGVYIYVLDRWLNRYVREKTLMRLKAEETKGIGKL